MDASDDLLEGEPPTIDPYEVLDLERTATADQVKSAYRKLALKNHPDKVSNDKKEEAHATFQSIAFAYAVLSDPTRRTRYDETGSTSESIVDADGFSWSDFYREQFRDAISSDAIAKFEAQYKGSDEEKDDILVAYEEHEGDMDAIYEHVMLSNVLKDDERFRSIIDEAIASKDVPAFKAYTKESKKSKQARIKAAKDEANEAEEYAKELGVHDKLFEKKGEKDKKGKKKGDEDALAALIQRRGQDRKQAADHFLDNLAAKYGATSSSAKKGRKRRAEAADEPSEEAFQAAAAKLKKSKNCFAPLVYYPQYCFHLSPTINKWCPLRAVDIANLECRPGFQDIDVFFTLNHPVRWVRITGVVVAIDDYYGRRVYTIDDSTGHCIECTLAVPKPSKITDLDELTARNAHLHERPGRPADVTKTTTTAETQNSAKGCTLPPPPSNVDIGSVVDVKGSIQLFRSQKQIKVQKLVRIHSTDQEVLFWDKIRAFRRDVLSEPWILSDREVRKCRKLQQVEVTDAKEKRKKDRRTDEKRGVDSLAIRSREKHQVHHHSKDSLGAASKAMKAERAAKVQKLRARKDEQGQYNALGL
ncbi:hypothetical protein F5Y18DRAFT_415468 [Xylariaceae sp. FL1019]|nr:hypothetical protein F5Y18DRAFT_415468 [Xylariaceae sp. FL1019]